MPSSCARSMTACASAGGVSDPKFIVPRQSRLTDRPERPRCVYSIIPSFSRARYGVLLASIWSKSPYPLRLPPPPDHCHITAYLDALVWPPKNCAHTEVPRRHHPAGGRARLLVNDS